MNQEERRIFCFHDKRKEIRRKKYFSVINLLDIDKKGFIKEDQRHMDRGERKAFVKHEKKK